MPCFIIPETVRGSLWRIGRTRAGNWAVWHVYSPGRASIYSREDEALSFWEECEAVLCAMWTDGAED